MTSITHGAAQCVELVYTKSQLELCYLKLSLSTLPKLSCVVYMVSSEIVRNIEGLVLLFFQFTISLFSIW